MSPPPTPPANIVVTVAPSSSQTLDQSQTLSLTASVANDGKRAGVQWSVTGAGSLTSQTSSSATYAAPTTVSAATAATVTATSVTDSMKSASVQIAVNPSPAATTTSVPAATMGTAYSATVNATGGTGPFTWSVASGSLPPGLSLGSSTANSVTISGPNRGGRRFRDAASDRRKQASTKQPLSFLVNAPSVMLETSSFPAGVIDEAYSQTAQASSGVPPYVWSVASGNLPPGLTSNSGAGIISGTPTVAGSFPFVLQVTDTNTPTPSGATANVSITINSHLAIATTSLPSGSVRSAYAQAITATGGVPPYLFFQDSGNLPSGLTLSTNGAISGTPTATGASSFTFHVNDTDPNGAPVSGSLGINITAQDCPNNASFQGNYAFLLDGPGDFSTYFVVGSLVADGAGDVTAGLVDIAQGPAGPLPLTGT